MNPGIIAIKAINGQKLTAEERGALTPSLLATLSIDGTLKLSRAERDRIPAPLLATVAIGGSVRLESDEFDRFDPLTRDIVREFQRGNTGS